MKMPISKSHLQQNIDNDDEDRVGEVEEEPDLHWLDVSSAGEAGGHREVDRGQDHHAGDVDGVDQAELVFTSDVVGGLVDDVHEDSWEVGHQEDTPDIGAQTDGDCDPCKSLQVNILTLLENSLPFAVLVTFSISNVQLFI